jgi:hypothetical protein
LGGGEAGNANDVTVLIFVVWEGKQMRTNGNIQFFAKTGNENDETVSIF